MSLVSQHKNQFLVARPASNDILATGWEKKVLYFKNTVLFSPWNGYDFFIFLYFFRCYYYLLIFELCNVLFNTPIIHPEKGFP